MQSPAATNGDNGSSTNQTMEPADESEGIPSPKQAIKEYHLPRRKYWSYKHISIHQDSNQVYNVVTGPQISHSPQVNLFSGPSTETLLATARLRPATKFFRIKLGSDVDFMPQEDWAVVQSESKLGRCFRFEVQGKMYRWKRTHRQEWGAKWWSDGNFKLDHGEGKVLAVYVTANVVKSLKVAKMIFFEEMDDEVERESLAVVLRTAERIRRE